MRSIVNLLNTNIRKFDAKKRIFFFCPECLDCVNHQQKLIFFNKNKISLLEVELQLKIKSIESQAAKIICFLYRKCSNFSINECCFLNLKKIKDSWNPPPPLYGRTRRGVQIFLPINIECLVKQVGLFKKNLKRGITYFHTN